MSNIKGFRHEDKYILNISDYQKVKNKLGTVLECDKNTINGSGYYKVTSLYFDNMYDKCLLEKINGVNNREKYRIRYYNDDLSYIKLEKKIKINGLCKKISCGISKEEYKRIVNQDIQWMLGCKDRELLRELYIKIKTQLLRMTASVEYNRTAFICNNSDIRVTLDRDLRVGVGSGAGIEVDSGKMILELKYKEYIPDIISKLLEGERKVKCSYSKYEVCRRRKISGYI